VSEQGHAELAGLLARPPAGEVPGGYGTVLLDTPGFGAGLPAAPEQIRAEQIRAAGPGAPRLPHVDPDRRRALEYGGVLPVRGRRQPDG
jgi:hypothetical protein